MYFALFCNKIGDPANLPFWGVYCAYMVKEKVKRTIYLKKAHVEQFICTEILFLRKKLLTWEQCTLHYFATKYEIRLNLPFWGFYCTHMVKVRIIKFIYLKNAYVAKLLCTGILFQSQKLQKLEQCTLHYFETKKDPINFRFWGFECAHMVKVTMIKLIYLKKACMANLICTAILLPSKKLQKWQQFTLHYFLTKRDPGQFFHVLLYIYLYKMRVFIFCLILIS